MIINLRSQPSRGLSPESYQMLKKQEVLRCECRELYLIKNGSNCSFAARGELKRLIEKLVCNTHFVVPQLKIRSIIALLHRYVTISG
jgi:hypothetical protein